MPLRVILLAGHRNHKITSPLRAANLDYFLVNSEAPGWKNKWRELARLIRSLFIGHHNSILMVDYPGYFAVIAFVLCRLFKVPFVLRVRGDVWVAVPQWSGYLSRQARLGVANFLVSHADLVISVSRHLAAEMIRKGYLQPQRSAIIPIPVEPERHEIPADALPSHVKNIIAKSKAGLILLTVTNLDFEGKVQALMDGFPVINRVLAIQPDTSWLIVGSGRYLPSLQNALSQFSPLNGKVFLLGFISPVASLLEAADVFVYFSYEDGCPGSVLEAQLAGRPVLVNGFAPLLELVSNEDTGYVIHPEDVDASVEFVLRVLRETSSREAVGRRAKTRAESKYSNAKVGEQFKDALARFCSLTPGRDSSGKSPMAG
jgi:glycosyltransferase involved in cell wall biosynthesis